MLFFFLRTLKEITEEMEGQLAMLREHGGRLGEPCGEAGHEEHTVLQCLAEKWLRIRTKEGELAAMRMNRIQREFERNRGRVNIVLKARQVGLSTWVAARFFVKTITQPGTLTVQVAHDQQSAEEIFRIVHRFAANLPAELREGALRTSRANVRQLVFPLLDSQYRVETAADANAGRGLTLRNLHASEVARWPGRSHETLAGLAAAVAPDGEIVMESTPNGASGTFYDEWHRADESGAVRHFFPWWWDESYRRPVLKKFEPNEEELELMEKHGLVPEQIIFRRETRGRLRELAAQEFAEDAESCFLASGECMFEMEMIQERLDTAPPAFLSRDKGRLQVWSPPLETKSYVIGVDTASGSVRGDYACAQVVEKLTGLQCAELHGRFRPAELARRVAALGREFNNALIAVERNNHGYGVLAHLKDNEKYKNLYWQEGEPGWMTTQTNRSPAIAYLSALVACNPELVRSVGLLREFRSFVRRDDGSYAAAAGAHDDRVMAMAIAQKVRDEVMVKMRRG